MKIINKTTVLLFLVVVALTSCNNPISAPRTRPTEAMETALSSVRTAIVETQVAIPTTTPTIQSPTPFPEREMQVYTDPERRYAITFPADWKPTDKPNSFSGEDGFFETGYMPNMGYVTSDLTVLIWLAKIESKPEQSVIFRKETDYGTNVVSTKSANGESINYIIYETPRADPAHRFIYVKTGKYPVACFYANGCGAGFSWLKLAYEEIPKPGTVPLSPEESDFWKNAIPMPSNISVTEYALPPEAENKVLLHFVPEEARPVWKADTSPTPHKTTLKELGYEIKNFQLYRDGRILFDHVTHVSDIYRFQTDSGPITAFIVEINLGYKNYVIQNDAINAFGEYAEHTSDPVLYKGELLWARKKSGAEIKKSNGDLIYTFMVPSAYHYPILSGWNGHWILEVENFVIQDGEILNQKLGFQEMFEWGLVKDKPTYFFRKESKVGISHDGQILPIRYDDVKHGLCCEPAQDNPSMGNDVISFFGKRDGVWYYVVVKFE